MQDESGAPLIMFYQMYPDSPVPRRADLSLFGAMPLRAYRFCEPFTTASGFGWYVFPPIDFQVAWDGRSYFWRKAEETEWCQIDQFVVLPGFTEHFSQFAPECLLRFARSPFLAVGHEQGILQLWTGLVIKTQPDWAVLVRPLPNITPDNDYEVLDGIIETDWWFGPIVSPIRLCKTDKPITFRLRKPIYLIQPVFKRAYSNTTLGSTRIVSDLSTLSDDEWQAYGNALLLRHSTNAPVGSYKIEVRRRRQRDRHSE